MRRYTRADIRRKLENGWKEESRLCEIKAKQEQGESFGWKRAEFAEANCSIRVLSMMHPRSRGKEIERKKGYPETNYARESWESFGFFEPRESWRGENRG